MQPAGCGRLSACPAARRAHGRHVHGAVVCSRRSVAVGQVVVCEEGSGVVDTAEVECSACVSAEV